MLALSPDSSSSTAGRKLASPGPWRSAAACAQPPALWGLCAGSGSKPYQTVVDLTGPAFSCSCPSRKFPCKHALGLLLLWSSGQLPDEASPAGFADTWLSARAAKVVKAAKAADGENHPADETGAPADPLAAQKRAEKRASRITAGVAELDQWLRDLVRTGLAGAGRAGHELTDVVAARLVDAQAPGLATAVRRFPAVVASGEGWAGRLLEELAMVRLLTVAHQRVDDLPEALAATVRTRVGYPVKVEDVLRAPAVRDRWDVLSLRDAVDDRLIVRRVSLRGSRTGRVAVVLSFAPSGQPLDASLVPGTCVDADVHFYPGAYPLRAVMGVQHDEPGPLSEPLGCSVVEAEQAWGAALAADPWTTAVPVLLGDVAPQVSGDASTRGWFLVDPAGDRLGLRAGDALWTLLAVSGGRRVTVMGDCTTDGFDVAAVLFPHRLVSVR